MLTGLAHAQLYQVLVQQLRLYVVRPLSKQHYHTAFYHVRHMMFHAQDNPHKNLKLFLTY